MVVVGLSAMNTGNIDAVAPHLLDAKRMRMAMFRVLDESWLNDKEFFM